MLEIKEEVKSALKYGLGYELYKALIRCYGKRGKKAFLYVKKRKVKKYKDFFVVVGRRDYIIDDDFCTCDDFNINLKCKSPCAHILAVFIARELKIYEEYNLYYIDYFIK